MPSPAGFTSAVIGRLGRSEQVIEHFIFSSPEWKYAMDSAWAYVSVSGHGKLYKKEVAMLMKTALPTLEKPLVERTGLSFKMPSDDHILHIFDDCAHKRNFLGYGFVEGFLDRQEFELFAVQLLKYSVSLNASPVRNFLLSRLRDALTPHHVIAVAGVHLLKHVAGPTLFKPMRGGGKKDLTHTFGLGLGLGFLFQHVLEAQLKKAGL